MSKADRARKLAKKKAAMPPLEVKQDFELGKPKPIGPGRRNAPRNGNGQFNQDDGRDVAAGARARQSGMKCTKETKPLLLAPHMGDDVGRCIQAQHSTKARTVDELWRTWVGFCASRLHYRRRILQQTGFPSGMNIQVMPELFMTDDNHSVDIRSEEERNEAARQSYALWNVRVSEIPALEDRALLHSAENGHVPALNGTAPSPRGVALVRAIEALKKVVDDE